MRHQRYMHERDLAPAWPNAPLEPVAANDRREQVHEWIAACAAARHGSLAKAHRFDAQGRVKVSELTRRVATASLEPGMESGDVDLVFRRSARRAGSRRACSASAPAAIRRATDQVRSSRYP
ncbi:hypothetical protein BZL54_31190 [Burkholderia ubonensis subsp. mesacidophila]|uniref:Uncharacterized protein n=1 Tax=Burkholderia ubonensis subsp. mesacidophila TaxID=265293 RepID=A0A2A4F1E2_9BURK|nr:hypothetical protein BZL54_31190 [Burkholderia ubonensis subsp. mesacidophila]